MYNRNWRRWGKFNSFYNVYKTTMIFINGEGKAVYVITNALALNMQVLNYVIIFTPTRISESKNLNGYFHPVCSLSATEKQNAKDVGRGKRSSQGPKMLKSDAGLGGGSSHL